MTDSARRYRERQDYLENERIPHILRQVVQHFCVASHEAQEPEVGGGRLLVGSVGEGVHHVDDHGGGVGVAVGSVRLRGDPDALPLRRAAGRATGECCLCVGPG